MYSLGVNLSHDRSATLVGPGGKVVSIAQERLDGRKHSSVHDELGRWFSLLPREAIRYCLDAHGITLAQLDVVTFCNAVVIGGGEMRNLTVADCAAEMAWAPSSRLHVMNHHLAHAYSAFYPSGFDEAAVLVVDKGGSIVDRFRAADGSSVPLLERATIFRATRSGIEPVFRIQDRDGPLYENMNSLGGMYELATIHVGYTPFDAGKTMGLAPYGGTELVEVLAEHLELDEAGYQVSPTIQNVTRDMFPGWFESKVGAPSGNPSVPSARDAAVARAAQELIERAMVHLAGLAVAHAGSRNLCIAGGVGLNSVANTKVRRSLGLEHMFVQPAATDDGTSLGAALYGWTQVLKEPFRVEQPWPAAGGRRYSDGEVAVALFSHPDHGRTFVARPCPHLGELAVRLAAGKILGWFDGGSEFGPRALGHRSILADPRNPAMKDILNARVKFREGYRPYAASVLEERASEWFDIDFHSPHMLFVIDVLPGRRSEVPAISHVDGTCRAQTIRHAEQPRYHELIRAFEAETGVPMVLNTSFNVAGQPIVETPRGAIDTFSRTSLDGLYLQGYLLEKLE